MAIVMQGLTSTDRKEKLEILEMIANTDANTGYLHEGFHVDSIVQPVEKVKNDYDNIIVGE